jgi:DNA-binding SARP family transcriptional activator/tetratricopeptide (TPR) repeat protein
MKFRLLGPLETVIDDKPVIIAASRQQVALALLLLEAGHVVSMERIVDALWGEEPPRTARSQVQITISGLRRLLGGSVIMTRLTGYLIEASPECIDLVRFEGLLASGKSAAGQRLDEARRDLRAALALWRGPALEGVRSKVIQGAATRLNELRISACQDCLEVELHLGLHQEIIGELTELVAEHPLNERFRGQLMMALYRVGRQADALEVFRTGREVLHDELGIDPCGELCRLEQAILSRDPRLDLSGPRPSVGLPGRATPTEPVPRQLPRTAADFTGRKEILHEMALVVTGKDAGGDSPEVPVVVLSGRGGVGKTAIALRAAHLLSPEFPDGQLFLQHRPDMLNGSASLVEHLLRSLGVDSGTIPPDLHDRMALYRSVLAGRRVLVVIDGARSQDDVTPFLPGTRGCAAIVTCSQHFTELEGVHHIHVGPLDDASASRVLTNLIGERQVSAEPDAARELIQLCEGIPLAIRVVAAKLRLRPHWLISHMATQLRDETRRLDELDFKGASVRATIAVAYDSLDKPAQCLLRRLSLVNMADFASWVGAPLLDTDIGYAEYLFQQLVAGYLVEAAESGDGVVRFHLHDLVRIYAAERCADEESTADRLEAMRRLLRCWLFLATSASRRLYGGDLAVLHGTAEHWWLPEDSIVLRNDPVEWFGIERSSLVNAIFQAAQLGMDELCWDLATTAMTVFESGLYGDDWRDSHACALSAVRDAGNKRGEAALLYSLGTLETSVRVATARSYFGKSLKIFDEIGDKQGQAMAISGLALVDALMDDHDAALARYGQAIAVFRDIEDLASEAYTLKNMAQIHASRRQHGAAERMLNDALLISSKLGTSRLTAQVKYALAELELGRGRAEQAVDVLSSVLLLTKEAGDIVGQAFALVCVGNARLTLRDLVGAESALVEALDLAGRAGNRLIRGRSLLGLAELHLARDEENAALARVEQAIGVFREHSPRGVWQSGALELLGRIHQRTGRPDIAVHAWQAAELAGGTDSVLTGQIAGSLAPVQETAAPH